MKKVLFVFVLFLLVFGACAQETVYYNSTPTLQWDAVTEDEAGNPFLPEDVVEYEVYLWDSELGDVHLQLIGDLTFYELTTLTESVLSFPYRSNWVAGVRVKVTDGDANVSYSDIGFSIDDPPVTATGPFVYAPALQMLPMPQGLRDSGI